MAYKLTFLLKKTEGGTYKLTLLLRKVPSPHLKHRLQCDNFRYSAKDLPPNKLPPNKLHSQEGPPLVQRIKNIPEVKRVKTLKRCKKRRSSFKIPRGVLMNGGKKMRYIPKGAV
jgi:hypothetical protein